MAYSQVTTSLSKGDFEKKINNYGCHCFPNGSKIAGGAGPVVDLLDSKCKMLSDCHKCIQIEFGKDAVDVNDGRYTWSIDSNDGSIVCPANKNNHNPARQALCECDRHFANQLGAVWNDNDPVFHNTFYWMNSNNQKNNPVFDYDATCVRNSNNGGGSGNGGKDSCCGAAFPNKEPYNGANRGCCDGVQVYNRITQECCANGNGVTGIGAC